MGSPTLLFTQVPWWYDARPVKTFHNTFSPTHLHMIYLNRVKCMQFTTLKRPLPQPVVHIRQPVAMNCARNNLGFVLTVFLRKLCVQRIFIIKPLLYFYYKNLKKDWIKYETNVMGKIRGMILSKAGINLSKMEMNLSTPGKTTNGLTWSYYNFDARYIWPI